MDEFMVSPDCGDIYISCLRNNVIIISNKHSNFIQDYARRWGNFIWMY